MACTDYGQLGCDGKCDHPWDGKPGSCPKPDGIVGQVGGRCDGWPAPACQADGKCLDGTCLGCGNDGDLCCDQYSPNPLPCNNGTCQSNGDYQICHDECGLLEPGHDNCCQGEGQGCSQGVCNIDTQKCVPQSSDPCTGSIQYSVYFKDQFGCAIGPFKFTSGNDAEAQMCADSMATQYGAAGECALNHDAQETDICETSLLGSFPKQIYVCDPADFTTCEHSTCTNCSFANGACP
jgi:hypothetical protein